MYACREFARRGIDVIARRTRLAFLNVPATEEALPRIIEIMAQELKWSKAKQKVSAHRPLLPIDYHNAITTFYFETARKIFSSS